MCDMLVYVVHDVSVYMRMSKYLYECICVCYICVNDM